MDEERARTITVPFEPEDLALLKRGPSLRVEGHRGVKLTLGEAMAFADLMATAQGVMDREVRQALDDGWPPFIEERDMSVVQPEGYSTAIFRIREGGFPEIQLRCRMP